MKSQETIEHIDDSLSSRIHSMIDNLITYQNPFHA